jgi:Zn-dependent M28 family amino/carboxypeptidase
VKTMNTLSRSPRVLLAAFALMAATTCSSPALNLDTQALQALANEVEGERVWSNVTTLADKHLSDTPLECSFLKYRELFPELCHLTNTQARAWVKQQLESYGLTVHVDETSDPNLPTSNLIAELPGTSKPEEIIVVGAHFDAFWAGADDNTSGVAALLELARVLSKHRFARTLRFISFDLEEMGLVGSNRYVAGLGKDQVKLALVFDCIGYYSSTPGSQSSIPGLPTPAQGDFLALIGNDESSQAISEAYAINKALGVMKTVPLISPGHGDGPFTGDFQLSDHSAFWLTDRKAVFFTDTAFFRNPNYHKETDTVDTLDREQLTRATRLATASVAYWAGVAP